MHPTRKYIRTFLLIVLPTVFCLQAQEEDSLRRYLSFAAGNNPSVKAAYLAYEASLRKLPQAGAYADPTLEMGAFLSPVEFAEGRQVAQFQLMQMFPWFGTRKAARTEAQHMANMSFEAFREARDNVFMEVYAQWYALCALKQQLFHSEINLRQMEQIERLALRKYTSASGNRKSAYPAANANTSSAQPVPSAAGMNMGGAGSAMPAASATTPMQQMEGGMQEMGGGTQGMVEVLRVQLEKLALENRIENLRAEISAGEALFNTLLNRPAESPVALPDTLIRIPFRPDADAILQEIKERNPMLGMLREESLVYAAKAEMDRKMGYPMLGIGLQYMLMTPLKNTPAGTMNNTESAMSSMNGKDMLMPMLSVSIPLYRNKYKAAQKESLLMRQAGEMKQTDAFNRLEAELHQALYRLNEAARRIDLFRQQAELVRSAENLVTQEFVSGRAGLDGVIQIQQQGLDYRLKEAEAIAAYNTTVATIGKMISFITIE
ncbi:MAG: TolC family protein [Tannerellaceae bacterium]|jgi:outer membrane protein TolC|nr:TolC family protein [Tannerellaceae bacterium]